MAATCLIKKIWSAHPSMTVASTFSTKRAETPTCSCLCRSDLVAAICISPSSLNIEVGKGQVPTRASALQQNRCCVFAAVPALGNISDVRHRHLCPQSHRLFRNFHGNYFWNRCVASLQASPFQTFPTVPSLFLQICQHWPLMGQFCQWQCSRFHLSGLSDQVNQ